MSDMKNILSTIDGLAKDDDNVVFLHDSVDLELSEANKVFEHINELWDGEVRFTTVIEDESWEF